MAEHARKVCLPVPMVREVESWISLSRRYYSGQCAQCADWEWSANWTARYERTVGDLEARRALERERDERTTRGRRFYAHARLRASKP